MTKSLPIATISTVGLMATSIHHDSKPIFVRVGFDFLSDDTVRAYVKSAHTLRPLPKFGTKTLTQEQFNELPRDTDILFAKHAFALFGLGFE